MTAQRPPYRSLATLSLLITLLALADRTVTPWPAFGEEPAPLWWLTGTMVESRTSPTATVLTDGRVLVVGGRRATVELFDPATGAWTLTGRMTTARIQHTATLLQDGRVLVMGGGDRGEALNSAEVYDPATGDWADVAPMTHRRLAHTATLLLDGRVLVTGGASGPSQENPTAEIFNPVTGQWTLLGSRNCCLPGGMSMGATRALHTATLLDDGSVLIAGGFTSLDTITGTGRGDSRSAEIFNPTSSQFTRTGLMQNGRFDHTATLLQDGRVLVVGGATGLRMSVQAEAFDPVTRSWSQATDPLLIHRRHTATRLADGRVLIAGGGITNGSNGSELYDPALGQWSLGPNLVSNRTSHAAATLKDGRILLAGGSRGPVAGAAATPIALAEVLDVPGRIAPRPAGTVLLAEDFEDPARGALSTQSDTGREVGYNGGQYAYKNLISHTVSYVPIGIAGADVTVAIDVSIVGSPTNKRAVLACRYGSATSGGYRVYLDPGRGQFTLVRRDPDGEVVLAENQSTDAIRRGSEVNRLELSCTGATIAVAVNGETLLIMEDETYRDGRPAIGVRALEIQEAEVRFDNLLVTQR